MVWSDYNESFFFLLLHEPVILRIMSTSATSKQDTSFLVLCQSFVGMGNHDRQTARHQQEISFKSLNRKHNNEMSDSSIERAIFRFSAGVLPTELCRRCQSMSYYSKSDFEFKSTLSSTVVNNFVNHIFLIFVLYVCSKLQLLIRKYKSQYDFKHFNRRRFDYQLKSFSILYETQNVL